MPQEDIYKWLNILIFVIPIILALWLSFKGMKNQELLKQKIESIRRKEVINAKEYSVVSVPKQLVEEKKTGRRAIIVSCGFEKDPTLIDGKMELVPRWVKVQYILKNGRCSSKISSWRSSGKFNFLKQIEINQYEEL